MSAISFLLAALRITKPDGYLAYLVASLFPLLVSLLAFTWQCAGFCQRHYAVFISRLFMRLMVG